MRCLEEIKNCIAKKDYSKLDNPLKKFFTYAAGKSINSEYSKAVKFVYDYMNMLNNPPYECLRRFILWEYKYNDKGDIVDGVVFSYIPESSLVENLDINDYKEYQEKIAGKDIVPVLDKIYNDIVLKTMF